MSGNSHFWWTMAASPFALWVAAILVMFTKPQTPQTGRTGSEIGFRCYCFRSLREVEQTGG